MRCALVANPNEIKLSLSACFVGDAEFGNIEQVESLVSENLEKEMPSQWERFKQSNIAKIVIGYSLVVWVLIQLIEAVLPTFETPLWVAQTLTFLLILGFPIALLVGWAYEKLPTQATDHEGESRAPQLAHATPKKTLVLVGIGSCAVIGLFGFYMMPFIFDESGFNSGPSIQSPSNSTPSFVSLRHKISLEQPSRRNWGSKTDIAISPDGESLVYSEYSPPTLQLKLLDLKSFDPPRLLASMGMNQDTGYPSFSEDGQWIYYHVNSGLMRVRLEGGSPQEVLQAGAASSGVAIRGQELVYSALDNSQLIKLNISTNTSNPISEIAEVGGSKYTWPQFVPGQNKLVVSRGSRGTYADSGIDVIDLDTGTVTQLINLGFKGRYIASGHMIFARGNSLWAQPVSSDLQRTSGEAIPVIFDAEIYEQFGNVGFSVSENGRLIYVNGSLSGQDNVNTNVTFVSQTGQTTTTDVELGNYAWAQFSPDGDSVSLTTFGTGFGNDLWIYDIDSTITGRRTFDASSSRSIWSLDSTKLFYRCGQGICSTLSNGTESPQLLVDGLNTVQPFTQTLDGNLIVSLGTSDKGAYLFDISGSEISENLLTDLELSNSAHGDVSLTSDNKWIAYYSSETGTDEIYIRPYPDISSGKWQVSRDGGRWPIWNDDESKLYFWGLGSQEIMSVDYRTTQDQLGRNLINLESPQPLFNISEYRFSPSGRPWDYSATLDEFVFVENPIDDSLEETARRIQLHVIEDWFEELGSLAPAAGL